MAIITLAQVKTQLGIAVADYDAAITAQIPFIEAKVKSITRKNWNDLIYGNIVTDSDFILVFRDVNDSLTQQGIGYDYILDYIEAGAQVTGTGISTGAYIADIFPDGTSTSDNAPQIQISSNATETTTGLKIFLGFPIQYFDVVSKGIWYQIAGLSTTLPGNPVSAKRMGPVNVSYSAADNAIDAKYGMPAWFVKGLPRYHGGM